MLDYRQEAMELYEDLLPKSRGIQFAVGTNEHGFMVYVMTKRRSWRAPTPNEWAGKPVQWKFGLGQIKPLSEPASGSGHIQPSKPNE